MPRINNLLTRVLFGQSGSDWVLGICRSFEAQPTDNDGKRECERPAANPQPDRKPSLGVNTLSRKGVRFPHLF